MGRHFVGWHAGAFLSAKVAKTHVVEAAPHAEVPAIVLGGVVPDDLVATLPLELPPNLICPVPPDPRPVRLEWPRQTDPVGTLQAFQGIPCLLVVSSRASFR